MTDPTKYESGYRDGYHDLISPYDLAEGVVRIRGRDYEGGYWDGVDDRLEEDEDD